MAPTLPTSNAQAEGGDCEDPQLVLATRDGNVAGVRALLRQRADPNARDIVGETALFEAAAQDNIRVVAALLCAGADPDLRSPSDLTARELAASEGIEALFAAFSGDNVTTGNAGTSAIAVILHDSGLGEEEIREVENRLHIIMEEEEPQPVPAHATEAYPEEPPLILACREGNLWQVLRLLQHKADPNASYSSDETTPLFEAALQDNSSVVAALLLANADPASGSTAGERPADIAMDASVKALLDLAGGEQDQEVGPRLRRDAVEAVDEALREPIKEFLLGRGVDLGIATSTGWGVDEEDSVPHETCQFCTEICSTPLRCSACKSATYCSAKCQKDDWRSHKPLCRKASRQDAAKQVHGAAQPQPAQRPTPSGELIDFVAKQAIEEKLVRLRIPDNSTFGDVKAAIAKRAAAPGRQANSDAEAIMRRLWLVHKECGAYVAYKDKEPIDDIREVIFVGIDLPAGVFD